MRDRLNGNCLSEPLPFCTLCEATLMYVVFALLTVLRNHDCGLFAKVVSPHWGLGVTRIVNFQCLPTEVHCQNKVLVNTCNLWFHMSYGNVLTMKYSISCSQNTINFKLLKVKNNTSFWIMILASSDVWFQFAEIWSEIYFDEVDQIIKCHEILVTITSISWQLFLMRFKQKINYRRAEHPANWPAAWVTTVSSMINLYIIFLGRRHSSLKVSAFNSRSSG